MNVKKKNVILIILILMIIGCSKKGPEFSQVNYFGQEPPGMTPKIFAPGFISTRYHEHSTPNYSPGGDEMVYTLSSDEHMIMYMKKENGKWSVPKPISFTGKYSDDGHVWSNDGKKLYFRSQRPSEIDSTGKIYSNWVSIKKDQEWEEPVPNNFSAYSFSKNGNNYFYLKGDETGWDIYFSKSEDDHQTVEKLDSNINSDQTEGTPYIAPDESYLIFASAGREDTIGIMDLYISFKKKDGTWSRAKNIGSPVNKPGHVSRFPRVSPDGKYLFYWCNLKNDPEGEFPLSAVEKQLQQYKPYRPEDGKDGDIYWVSIDVIK